MSRRHRNRATVMATNDEVIFKLLSDENYKVTENGTILTRYSKNGLSVTPHWRKVGTVDKDGYHVVKPTIDGKRRYLKGHRIVYAHFYGKLEADKVVNHKDGNVQNNSPDNLELVSWEYNCSYRA